MTIPLQCNQCNCEYRKPQSNDIVMHWKGFLLMPWNDNCQGSIVIFRWIILWQLLSFTFWLGSQGDFPFYISFVICCGLLLMNYQIQINLSHPPDPPANKTVLLPCCNPHVCRCDNQGMQTESCDDHREKAAWKHWLLLAVLPSVI